MKRLGSAPLETHTGNNGEDSQLEWKGMRASRRKSARSWSGFLFFPSYTGSDTYAVQKQFSNSSSPTFGYLLVTVYTDNTWSAEFRGFKFNHWNTSDVSLSPTSVMDSFACRDGVCSCNNPAVCVE